MFSKPKAIRKMKNIGVPIFAIDFEGSRKLGVVEYGIAEISGGKIASARTRICAPKTKIGARDAEFFGIDNTRACAMPPFSDDLPMFCELRARGVFASHNASVEDSLLRAELPTPGVCRNFSSGREGGEWGPWIDTCALSKNIFPDLPSAKLSDMIAAFSLGGELEREAAAHCPERRSKWHCALYDAVAAALLLIKICSLDGFEEVGLPWLLKYSGNRESGQETLF